MWQNYKGYKGSEWESGLEMSCCGRIGRANVVLSQDVHNCIHALLEEFPTLEWLGYLLGKLDGNVFRIEDIVIPEQEVTVASVEVKGKVPKGTVGVIHSHHQMASFFSGTDTKYVNANHGCSIVVSSNGGYKATARVKSICGLLVRTEADVRVEFPRMEKFLAEVNAKIKKFEVDAMRGFYSRESRSDCPACGVNFILDEGSQATCYNCGSEFKKGVGRKEFGPQQKGGK